MPAARYTTLTLYQRLLRQARPYWLHIAGILLLSLLSTPFALLTPLPLKIAVDSLHRVSAYPWLPRCAPASVCHHVLRRCRACPGGRSPGSHRSAEPAPELGSSLLRTYTGKSWCWTSGPSSSARPSVSRSPIMTPRARPIPSTAFSPMLPAIQYMPIDGVIPFITAGLHAAGMIYVTAQINWQLALVALAVSPFLLLVSPALPPAPAQTVARGETARKLRLFSGAGSRWQPPRCESFRTGRARSGAVRRRSGEGMRARLLVALPRAASGLLIGLTTAVGTAAVLYHWPTPCSVREPDSGRASPGDGLSVAALRTSADDQQEIVGRLQSHLASAERAFALLDEAPDVAERPNARPLHAPRAPSRSATSPLPTAKTVRSCSNVSFEIDPGTRVGDRRRNGRRARPPSSAC